MRALLVTPVAVLALASAPTQMIVPITYSEAVSAITKQIHKQVAGRLRGAYKGEARCSGSNPQPQELTAATQLNRWRCTLQLRGARFPRPCKAEAYVSATSTAHHVRIAWLAESRYCREGRAANKR
jgi:hypothetical protein